MYAEVADRLQEGTTVDVTALPDGSVDTFYHVLDAGSRVTSRERFGELVASGAKSFRVEPRRSQPGGQAVNMALQAHALGDEVRLFGHLGRGRFPFPFEVVSMGEPARVSVLSFEERDLMLSEASADIARWTVEDLRAAGGVDALRTDAVCCGNWASLPGLTDALQAVAEEIAGDTFVLDPGDVTGVGSERARVFADALGALAGSYEVVLSANRAEVEHLADRLDVDADEDAAVVDGIRHAAGIAGVVLHGITEAVAATPEGELTVPNLETVDPVTATGGGDRFSAGLAHARAAGWSWRGALALGNACASYHVERGESGSREALATYVRARREIT